MLDHYSIDEIEMVMAYELGHHVHRHIADSILAQSAVILVALYLSSLTLSWGVVQMGFRDIADVAAFPLLALVVGAFTVLARPIGHAYSLLQSVSRACRR